MYLLALTPAEAAGEVIIQGDVRLANGTPVCAMVLANGQYMFSCDGTGAYKLNVPLDPNGEITLFAFADGFAPFGITISPSDSPYSIRMTTATPYDPLISMSQDTACSGTHRVRISGEIKSKDGQPLCSMVLANGVYMFSCDESLGRYDLDVPVDNKGQVTIFGFADGFQSYSKTVTPPECPCGPFQNVDQEPSEVPMGLYTGVTSQNLPIEICVEPKNFVTLLKMKIKWNMSFQGYCTAPFTLQEPSVSITNYKFDTKIAYYPGSTITTKVSGSYDGLRLAGSYDGFSGGYSYICGNYLSIGTGYLFDGGTWEATLEEK